MSRYVARVGRLVGRPEKVRVHRRRPAASPTRAADLALLAAAVGDVPLRLVDPDRDGGRDGDEREDQDDSRTLDGRVVEVPA